MRHYRLDAHTKSDLKVHGVWTPKYRETVLSGDLALRVREVIRQIAADHELEIVSGKVARDHVHVFLSYRPTQKVGQNHAMVEGDEFPGSLAGVSAFAQEVLGAAFLGTWVPGRQLRHDLRTR